jgi:hypothetical protein
LGGEEEGGDADLLSTSGQHEGGGRNGALGGGHGGRAQSL